MGAALFLPLGADRGPAKTCDNWDVALYKRTRITERISLDICAEFFNVFNHAQFGTPAGDFTGANFGQVTSVRDPRIGQVAAKIHF